MISVVIATLRTPKVNGVKLGFLKAARHFGIDDDECIFLTRETPSGVAATPTTLAELLAGAASRAKTAFEGVRSEGGVDGTLLSAGVEGGVWRQGEAAFLQSWACMYDGERSSFGSSGAIEIPDALATAVFEEGADLGVVIDRFAEEHDVRSRQGTWGVLTRDLYTREDSFVDATINAVMPVLNVSLYDRNLQRR
jgi:inosine/xanthosine triphosphatase